MMYRNPAETDSVFVVPFLEAQEPTPGSLVGKEVLNVLKNLYLIWLACLRSICHTLSWIMSSYHMVCLLSLSWRPRSPHLVVWLVHVGGGSWLNVAASHCVSAPMHCALYTVHCALCNVNCAMYTVHCALLHHQNGAPLSCSSQTMLHCGPRGTILHHLVPSCTQTMLPGEHALLHSC